MSQIFEFDLRNFDSSHDVISCRQLLLQVKSEFAQAGGAAWRMKITHVCIVFAATSFRAYSRPRPRPDPWFTRTCFLGGGVIKGLIDVPGCTSNLTERVVSVVNKTATVKTKTETSEHKQCQH